MRKRMVSTLLAATMLAGCQSSAKETAASAGKQEQAGDTSAAKDTGADTGDASGKKLKVVYLCNGNLGDKGFNDSAARGMEMLADKLGAEVKTIEMGRDETSYEKAITWMCPSRTGT